mgnify:CR=1 FL=1
MTKLGELVKAEFDSKNCGHGYDPKTETYTPWYRFLRFRVKYMNKIDGTCDGHTDTRSRLIEVKRYKVIKTAAILYHETKHADFFPMYAAMHIGTFFGGFWITYSNSENFGLLIGTLAGSGAVGLSTGLIEKIEEWYANKNEVRMFGIID